MFRLKKNVNTNNVDINIDIDIVISWVDSSDIIIKNKIYENKKNIKGYSNENLRFGKRDTLRYVLRGIYKNIPWVRNIYLITKSQWPDWLNQDIAKNMKPPIIRIDEKDIHPEGKECNGSIAVEACMYRIPNLSEFFIYTNDDMFICKPMKKNDWMFNNDIGYVQYIFPIKNIYKRNNTFWYDNAHIDQIKLFKQIYPKSQLRFFCTSHVTTIYNKEIFKMIEEKYPKILKDTQDSKGRIFNNLIIARVLAEYISLETGRSVLNKEKYIELFRSTTNYKNLELNKYTNLFCTNINCYLNTDENSDYYNFMNSIFHEKLECEI